MTSNVNISINAPQFSKKAKRRTFSTAYKKYVCMRIRNGEERVVDVAKEEQLSDAYVYKLLHIYDTNGFEDDTTRDVKPTPTLEVLPNTNEKVLLETIEQITKQVVNLTQEFTAFKHKLAVLAA